MKEQNTRGYDVLRDCSLLEKDCSFANLYSLICSHGSSDAAMWIENGSIRTLTYDQLSSLADNYASVLAERFPAGSRVCISMDSRKEWFPLFWGLVRSGHDILTVDAAASDAKFLSLMDQCGCCGAVCDRRRNLPEGYDLMTIAELADAPAVSGYKPVWGHDLAICTSGTTSDSRVFVYDEETICHIALFSRKVYNDNKLLIDDRCFRTLAFLPFHHILGFSAIFIWSHFLGHTTVYLKDRSPRTITSTAATCGVNQIVSVPLLANSVCRSLKAEVERKGAFGRAAFNAMTGISIAAQRIAPQAGFKLACSMFKPVREKIFGNELKSILLGGSHTDSGSLRLLNAIGYYTVCGFGMTETAITGFETSMTLEHRLSGCIGLPMDFTEYSIRPVPEAGNGADGELLVRGKGLHDGRFVDGKLLPPDVDKDGWFSTGDIVRRDAASGRYFIEGRIKEIIVNESGENVYPDEMEEIFSGLEGVGQVCLLGLKRGKGPYEDITLVLNLGEKTCDNGLKDRVAAAVRSINTGLPVYKRLARAYFALEALPVANGFKVKRMAVKKMLEEGSLKAEAIDLSSRAEAAPAAASPETPAATDAHREEIARKVQAIYSSVLNLPEKDIDRNANFIDELGGDSLEVLSIVTQAEEEFGVMIPAEMYTRCASVNGAAAVLDEIINGGGKSAVPELTIRAAITDFEDTPEYRNFKERQDALLADGHNPYFVCHESPLRDTSIVDGREILDFGSYNYVGMSGRREVSEAAKAAIDKYGTSASGSRLLAGEKKVHGELERAIAEWKHAESAIVCVGGHSTNVTVVGNFCGKNDLILYDALAHNSIEQGCRLSEAVAKPFPHNDLETLEKILKAQRRYFEKVLIVIEGAYSMDGDVADVPGFVALKKKYGCFLMVDEAHSACVLGATGGGVDEYFGLAPDDIDLKMGTLSKGLGTCGGYIAGRKCLIDYLHYNLPGFVFSVGMSPALAAASLEAVRLLRSDPSIMQSLHSNIECFVSEAKKRHLDIGLAGKTAVIPVIVGKDEDAVALSNELGVRGISVPPAIYPAVPRNRARLRFDVCSEHKPEQIVKALDTLVQAAADLGITMPYREY